MDYALRQRCQPMLRMEGNLAVQQRSFLLWQEWFDLLCRAYAPLGRARFGFVFAKPCPAICIRPSTAPTAAQCIESACVSDLPGKQLTMQAAYHSAHRKNACTDRQGWAGMPCAQGKTSS